MKLLITRPIAPEVEARIAAEGIHMERWSGPGPMPREKLSAALAVVDGAITMLTDRIDDEVLPNAGNLRIVANLAVGFDNFDLRALTRRGIFATNTPEVLTVATAELTLSLILSLLRGLLPAARAVTAGTWTGWSPDGFLGRDLYGKTVGIVGWGRIGQAVAERLSGFEVEILATGRRPQEVPGGHWVVPEELLRRSDVVTLHLPLSAETHHWLNGERIRTMKPGSYVVNTARGGVVDSGALVAALESGHLAGAALDVFEVEPIARDHPLAAHPKILATPHIGSATVETRRAMAERAWANVAQVFRGESPRDLINPAVRDGH